VARASMHHHENVPRAAAPAEDGIDIRCHDIRSTTPVRAGCQRRSCCSVSLPCRRVRFHAGAQSNGPARYGRRSRRGENDVTDHDPARQGAGRAAQLPERDRHGVPRPRAPRADDGGVHGRGGRPALRREDQRRPADQPALGEPAGRHVAAHRGIPRTDPPGDGAAGEFDPGHPGGPAAALPRRRRGDRHRAPSSR